MPSKTGPQPAPKPVQINTPQQANPGEAENNQESSTIRAGKPFGRTAKVTTNTTKEMPDLSLNPPPIPLKDRQQSDLLKTIDKTKELINQRLRPDAPNQERLQYLKVQLEHYSSQTTLNVDDKTAIEDLEKEVLKYPPSPPPRNTKPVAPLSDNRETQTNDTETSLSHHQLRRERLAARRQRAKPDTPPPEITGTENTDAMAHQRRTGSPNETKRTGIYESIDNEAPSQEVNQAQSTFYLNQDGSINSDHAEEKTKKGGLKRKIGMELDKLKMPDFRNKGKKSPTSSPESKQLNLSAKNISKPTHQEQTPDRELQTKYTQITKNMLALQTLSCLLPKDMEQEITTLATNASSQTTTITKGQSDLREGQEQVTVMEEQATSLKEKIGAHLKTKYGLAPTPTTGSTFDLYTSLENANMDALIPHMRELGSTAPKPLIAAVNQKMMEDKLVEYVDSQKTNPKGLFRRNGNVGAANRAAASFDTNLLSEEILLDQETLSSVFKKRLLASPLFKQEEYRRLIHSGTEDFQHYDYNNKEFEAISTEIFKKLSTSQKTALKSSAKVMSYALQKAPKKSPANDTAVVAKIPLAGLFINNLIDQNGFTAEESFELLKMEGITASLPWMTDQWTRIPFRSY